MKSNGSNCNRDALIAWLDDSLTQEARARLRDHLIGCDACKSQLKSLESTLELTQSSLQPLEMGSCEARAFGHKIRGRIVANQRGVWRKILSPALGGGFVSGAVVGALALFVALEPVAEPGSGTRSTAEVVPASAADSEVGDIDTMDAIDDYLLDTASEQELFSEMQSLIGEEDLLALLEEY